MLRTTLVPLHVSVSVVQWSCVVFPESPLNFCLALHHIFLPDMDEVACVKIKHIESMSA